MFDLPSAEVAHRSAQRLRLRFPRQRGDADFFTKLERSALGVEGVLTATGRPATGSLIIRHKSDFDTLAERLRDAGVCNIRPGPEDHRPEVEAHHLSDDLDSRLYQVSGGQLDLRAVGAFALVLMGILQIARGRVAVPATTALWYGLTLLLANGRGAPPPGNGE
ncbi:hypothetical protein [Dichotomicrobium thermohalophilum]|uniref:hypothetical protein n=1 Tax=Dichotomicrobium thermohalophilum TaxID=933063 RepID=UPI0011C22101|nr:hypothetical protein [Dichotomicrobium thermohalophilum]